jgi:hypothetical protein
MAWRIAGPYVGACSCNLICPCAVDGTPTDPSGKGECRGAVVFRIEQGNFDNVDLSGVNFAFYLMLPSNLTSGDWKVGIVVDEGASDEQAQSVERILSGQVGGAFGELAQFFGEYLGMERAAVTFSDGDTPSASVAGRSEMRFEPLRGVDGTPTTIKMALFGFAPEYRIGRASGRSDAFGLSSEFIYGEAANFEFSSEEAAEVRGRA